MKRNVISTVILAVAALLAVGCTHENVAPEPQPTVTTRNVSYLKCGESGHATVTGDEAWHALLDTLFDAVDEGCVVSFWEAADGGAGQPTKESVTYRTASRDSAYAWGERMYDQGYTVSVIFDPDSGQYVCSAAKITPVITTTFEPIPLSEYLPGTWVIDGTVLAWYPYGEEHPDGNWWFDYGYNYSYNDSLVFTDSTVYTTVMGGSWGPYIILDSNTIQMQLPLYQVWYMYEFSSRSIIYQLDENRMLIHGYLPNQSFLGYLEQSLDDFTYLFVRQ